MVFATEDIQAQNSTSKKDFQENLIDRTLIIFCLLGFIAFVVLQFRIAEFGWQFRDSVQAFLLISIILTTLFRKRLSAFWKTSILTSVFTIAGFSGFYTLGFFAGAIWFIPLSVIVLSLTHSFWTVFFYILIIISGILGVANKFVSDKSATSIDLKELLYCQSHWALYGYCVFLFLVIAVHVIFEYSKSMTGLLSRLSEQTVELEKRNKELASSLEEVKTLRGLISICSYCKKIRKDDKIWEQIESYIHANTYAEFTHGVCPECFKLELEKLNDPSEKD